MPDDHAEQETGKKLLGWIVTIVALAMCAFHLYTAQFGLQPAIIQRGIHLLFGVMLVFLLFPSGKGTRWEKWFRVLDYLLMAAGVIGLAYLVSEDRNIVMRGGAANTTDLFFGSIVLVVTMEATRRVLGPALTIIAGVSVLYALFGQYIPGAWGHRGMFFDDLISYQFLTTEGLFSVPLGASANFIFLFILFGAFLVGSGTGEFFIKFANAIAGHLRGGPAKVAVIASASFGTISGSAVANVVSTGSFTIPLMKKIGYRPVFAGAIEAVASTGGQFMPPVMGAGAFIMADMLGISYLRVCQAALIPAILYFFALLYMVHMEALRKGLQGIPRHELPILSKVMKEEGYLLIPAPFLVALLVMGYSPMKAGFWGIVAVLIVSSFKKASRMGFKKIIETCERGAKGSLEVLAACATAGIVIGVVTQTGLGLKFASLVIEAASGYLFLALVLVMITSLILGMGLTTSAAYILTVILGGPVLTNLGVDPLAAHMFVFYYACLSTITPPVALAAFAGAGIAGAPPFRTGFEAMRLAIIAYVVPFIFVYHPVLIWSGSGWQIALATVTAVLGCMAIGSALMGFMIAKLNWPMRIALLVAAFALLIPGVKTDIAGFALLVGIWLIQYFQSRSMSKTKKETAPDP
ncbi:MAG: TRAP transporter 4TM/12TM fusion protein [Syntrophaceae bacterium]|nr:MAG: TRAP transporter 4TM/12TM fusion protein [Syntrophaceae bacterium]